MKNQIKYNPMLNLKIMRIRKGMTQTELANKVGVSQNALSLYETGLRFPRRMILEKLAEILECDIRDIV